jgi:hypothetical protein
MALVGIVSQMGPVLCLAVLAELAGPSLLWDSQFTGTSRSRTLLGTSFWQLQKQMMLPWPLP